MRNNLTVFYGTKFIKYNNEYYCNGSFGRYIDLLSREYNKIILVVPVLKVISGEKVNDYKLKSKNIIIQELPEFSSYLDAKRKSLKIQRAIKKYSEKWEGKVYIRHPNPFTKYVYKISKLKGLNVYLHLVGDTKSVIREGTKYKGIIKKIALLHTEKQDEYIKKLIKSTPTLVNGNGLRRLYNNNSSLVKEIRTSTFLEKEIIKEIPKINKHKINLLYVGYLRHEKGIEYLLRAVEELKKYYNIKLTIVGDGDISTNLKKISFNLNIEDIVDFKGHVPLGDQLFNIYKNNDIFILPSISEGTPRVLLEAMSNGLPVVASNVGGIPFTIKDGYNGLLVSPKSSEDIINSIIKIIENKKLSKKLISNGIKFSKLNTLEKHVKEVSNFINK